MRIPYAQHVISALMACVDERHSWRKTMNYVALVLAITAVVPVTMAVAVLYVGDSTSMEGIGWFLMLIVRGIRQLSETQTLLVVLFASSTLMFVAAAFARLVPKRKAHRIKK